MSEVDGVFHQIAVDAWGVDASEMSSWEGIYENQKKISMFDNIKMVKKVHNQNSKSENSDWNVCNKKYEYR